MRWHRGVYQPGKNFLLDILADITPVTLPRVSLYWVFTVLLLIMLLIVSLVHFPRIELKDDERSGSSASYKKLFRQRYVWLFFTESFVMSVRNRGVSIFMSTFLEQYHGIDPKTVGAQSISYFWGSMTVGCLFGMFLLKLIDSKRLLQISGILSMSLLLIALFGSVEIAVWAFPAIGFCISMMYSIVFSLALNTVTQNHGSFAGILCSGIVGGAGGPLLVSGIRRHFVANGNVAYSDFHGIHYVYRLLGTSFG